MEGCGIINDVVKPFHDATISASRSSVNVTNGNVDPCSELSHTGKSREFALRGARALGIIPVGGN